MPVSEMIAYLKAHERSMCDGLYEVYIVFLGRNGSKIGAYKEEPVVMDYFYMLNFFENYRADMKRKNPKLYERSLAVFFSLSKSRRKQIEGYGKGCLE